MAQMSDDVDSDEMQEGDTFNVSSPKAATIQIGNDSKVVHNNSQKQINLNVLSQTFVSHGNVFCLPPTPGLQHDPQRHISNDEENDEYTKPVPTSVPKTAALLDKKENGDVFSATIGERESGKCSQPCQPVETPASKSNGRRENGECSQAQPRVETPISQSKESQDGIDDYEYDNSHGAIFSTSATQLNLSLNDLAEKFCRADEIQERERLVKRVCIILNCFSADSTESCKVLLSERKLRTYFLQSDPHSIEVRINIYCRHLTVMLQHGLRPETDHGENNAAVVKLLDRLKKMVKPPEYKSTSSLRKDIENVIDMLTLYSCKSSKQQKLLQNIRKCFSKISSESCFNENNVKSCLEKYLKSPTWIQLYLIMSWLNAKFKVLDDRKNANYLNNLLTVIIYFAKSLHKMNDQSFRWKFTITVVEILTENIKQKAEDLIVCHKSLDALVQFHELLNRKKKVLKLCMEIFYLKARLLLYINNFQIRRELLEKIFESTDLDTSSPEMTRERLKQSKTLNLEVIRTRHNSSFAVIFMADYKGSLVAAKCTKLSKECLLSNYGDLNRTNFSYELEMLSSVRSKRHPNIIQLIEFDKHLECLVLEYVSFGSLRRFLINHRLERKIEASFKKLILIAEKIAGALHFLEKEGIIHLAVQARNVLIHNTYDVKLTGFQFCRRSEEINEIVELRNIVLKPHFKWMDPQALLYQSVVARTVIWSFGVFLYELLTYGCEPYSRIKRHNDIGEFERNVLDPSEARVYVIRGGKLPKEACIPDSCYKIISERCCQSNYSDRTTFSDLNNLLKKERETLKLMDFIAPPPRLGQKEEVDVDDYDPGTSPQGDELPYAHLDVIDSHWNRKYSMVEIEVEESEDYTNADTSVEEPVLGIMKWNEKGHECKKFIVVEYKIFEHIKLVEQLQQLDCPELVNVLHVNRFGPNKLEMISESFPEGNIRDAMIYQPALRDNLSKYIPQAGSAVRYLHSQGIVHRKIKLENFFLCNQSQIKLGRLGMSGKEVDPNAIYCDPKENDTAMNIMDARWNAPEVLQWGSFTKESDVWSFGVVIWEFLRIWNILFDEKKEDVLPYATMSDDEVYKWVTEGNILQDPDPRQQSSHMMYCFICSRCWQWKNNNRPSIEIIVQELNELLQDPAVWKKSREQINNEQAELEHLPNLKENNYAESERESTSVEEYYNWHNNEDDMPREETEQEAVSDADDYTALRSERNVEPNVYQELKILRMKETDDINSDHEMTEGEITEDMSQEYQNVSDATSKFRSADLDMGSQGYVKKIKAKFENIE